MSTMSEFLRLRVKLDDAITYGTKKEAMRLAKQGLRIALQNRSLAELEYFKGQVDILKNNFAGAIEHFDTAIRYNPKDGASYNDRALCMVELGIIDESLKYFDKGIEVEPDFATIYHNKGWLLNNIGRYSEAVSCFKKALRLDPDRPVTYDNLADALYNLSDLKGALKAYRMVLELLAKDSCKGIRGEIKKRIKQIETEIDNAN